MVGQPFPSVVRQRGIADLIRDFGGKQTKIIEATLPGRRWRSPLILRIIMRRVIRRPRSAGLRFPIQEFRLLVLEDITEKVAMEDQLVQAEKLAAMAQLARGVAHEIANPLTSIASNLMFVRDRLGKDEAALQALDVTAERLGDMQQLLQTLSGFTRPAQPRYELADVHELIRGAVNFIAKDAEARTIQLSASFAPMKLQCEMDVRVIKQVFLNLLKNAMEAMPEGGRLEIRTWSQSATDNESAVAVIEIVDTGDGISDDDLRRVFRPLYSTKPTGAGLGLPFCRQAIEEHGGEIHLTSRKGSGTTVTLSIPVHQATLDQ
jgi:signal transduction histidine kinase